MSNFKNCHVIIINNSDFSIFSPRNNSIIDFYNLKDLFKHPNYTVSSRSNYKSMDMLLFLQFMSEHLETTVDGLIVFIMTHGCKNTINGTDGIPIYINPTILDIFNNCNVLIGKPKIYILQTCDFGKIVDSKYNLDVELYNAKIETLFTRMSQIDALFKVPELYCYPDTVISYASYPGYTSWHDYSGYWYIKTIIHVFKNNLHIVGRNNIVELLLSVNRIMASFRVPELGYIQMSYVMDNM